MELYKIFESNVLSEGRKEQVMARYPGVSKEVIENFSQNDPSGNNKYLEWMVGAYADGTDPGSVISVVQGYHSKLNLINADTISNFIEEKGEDLSNANKIKKTPKDIKSFDFADLGTFVDYFNKLTSKRKEEEEIKQEGDVIYKDKDVLIISPRSHRASCMYGKFSAWCVATSGTGHFANYTKNGTLYFFLSSKKTVGELPKTYPAQYWADATNTQAAGTFPFKTALLLRDDGEASWWSKGDTNYANGLNVGGAKTPFLTQEMVNKILAHNRVAIETRKQREIDLVLKSSGFYKRTGGDSNLKNNFDGFVRSEIYTPEQLVTIIRNSNWLALYENSDTGQKVRSTIGNNTVFSLIREAIASVNGSELLELLKDISAQEFFSKNNFESEEQNREIAKMIVQKIGKKPTNAEAGSDVKMYVDKWTMSPEDWAKYERTSNYFFVGVVEPDGNVTFSTPITKIDRFTPKDHQDLQIMTMSARHRQEDLYAVVTESGLLDEYRNKPIDSIPAEVINLIATKAKKMKK